MQSTLGACCRFVGGCGVMLAMLVPDTCVAQPAKHLAGDNIISENAAREMGRKVDTEGFRKIIAQGNVAVFHLFLQGMYYEGIHLLPAEIEDIAIANFDDPLLGKAIRSIFLRYQTRKMFELHAARIRAATDIREPSFEQIFNTHLSDIEDALAGLAPRYPSTLDRPNMVAEFLGARKHPAGVPLLIAELSNAITPPNARILQMLKQYPSTEVWKAALNALTSLHTAGRIETQNYKLLAKDLEDSIALAAGPKGTVAYWKKVERKEALNLQTQRIQPNYDYIRALNLKGLRDKKWDPNLFAVELARYLEKVEVLAQEMSVTPENFDMSLKYFSLGMALRFQLKDPEAAVRAFSKAASYRNWLGQIAVADTYQFAMNNKQGAIAAYEKALGSPDFPPKHSGTQAQWNNRWLTEEINFLRTGKRFSGGLSEVDVAGFFEAMNSHMSPFLNAEGTREALGELIDGNMAIAQSRQNWPEMSASVGKVMRAPLSARLDSLPASRLILRLSFSYISCLPDAESILRQLAKNDPSGFWSTPWLAAARAVSQSEVIKAESLKNGVAGLMPGIALGSDAPIVAAANQFMNARKAVSPASGKNTQRAEQRR